MMNKIFYISDNHFFHNNVIKLDNRPFDSMDDMNSEMIKRWNNIVKDGDLVYVLGDFCWSRKSEVWEALCDSLKGNKYLIKGNHDMRQLTSSTRQKFAQVCEYKEIDDHGRRVIMSHYPMPFYRSDYRENVYMLYGHIHNTEENDMMRHITDYIKKIDSRDKGRNLCQTYNVGAMMPWMDYTPRTLDEIIEGVK